MLPARTVCFSRRMFVPRAVVPSRAADNVGNGWQYRTPFCEKIATRSQNWPDYIHKIEVSFNFRRGAPFYLNRGRDPAFPYDLALFGVVALRARCLDGQQWLDEEVGHWHAAWDAQLEVHYANGSGDVGDLIT